MLRTIYHNLIHNHEKYFLDHTIVNPTWSVTRRERTEVSPSRAETFGTSPTSSDNVYRSRTITTTEKIQIVQTPMEYNEENPEHFLASLSPSGNVTKTIESTVTTFGSGPVPVIGGVTSSGVPLVSGITFNRDTRETTTVITTTTTTYKILEGDEEDISGSEYEIVEVSDEEQNELTIDFPLLVELKQEIEDQKKKMEESQYVLVDEQMTKSIDIPHGSQMSHYNTETESVVSPLSPKSPLEGYVNVDTDDSFVMSPASEQSTERGEDITEFDYVQLYSDGREYVIYPSENYDGEIRYTVKANEMSTTPIDVQVRVYHSGRSDENQFIIPQEHGQPTMTLDIGIPTDERVSNK